MVRLLQEWCASSREKSPFIEKFPAERRMRLHLVSEGDMKTSVDSFLSKFSLPTAEHKELTTLIVHRAEGVFLWIRLVLIELEEKLDLQWLLAKLEATLNSVPEKLEDLIDRILESIKLGCRKEAAISSVYWVSAIGDFHQ